MQVEYHLVFVPVVLTHFQRSWLSAVCLKAQGAVQKASCAIARDDGQVQLFQLGDLLRLGNQFLHQRFPRTQSTLLGKDVHTHDESLVPVFDALLTIKSDYTDQGVIKSP